MKNFDPKILFRRTALLLLWSTILLVSCKDDNPAAPEENKYLKESSKIKDLTKDDISKVAGAISPLLTGYVKNGVTVYKITYETKNTDGKTITASGALIIPVTDQPASLISVQHGTILNENSAPSHFQDGSEAASFGTLFGSLGYIIAYPDYIGYGSSAEYEHPYEHKASFGTACLDMLRASKEFLRAQSSVKWDNKLYVAGYSEGGYATMSLHKKIEEEASSEFNLIASSCGAGAYDKTAFMKYVINNTTHGNANYNRLYLWVLLTYDRIYNLNRPKSYYFKEPFATQIEKLGLDYSINQSFDTILNDSFKTASNNGSDKGFIDAIGDNDVYNWKPKVPTRLYHGNADQLVFYFNSEKAYSTMKALGAADVQLITIDKGDHGSSIDDFLLGTLAFFTTTK